jgi:hypothetical protein
MKVFEYFVYYAMAPLVLSISLLGNITALVVFFKGKMKKIGPVLIYKFMFIWDIIFITQIVIFYLQYTFNLSLVTLTRFTCKLLGYFNQQSDTITPLLLIYISIEKYISLSTPSKHRKLNSTKNQIIYFICVFVYCSACGIVTPLTLDKIEYNQTDSNGTSSSYSSCEFVKYEAQLIVVYIDLLNRQFIPGILMICFSFLLVSAVFRSSARVAQSINNQNRRKRDIRLAINCFFMNFMYLLLNTPITVVFFLPNIFAEEVLLLSTTYLFFLAYGMNFFVLLICNSLFREEFSKILGQKPQAANANQQNGTTNATQIPPNRNNNNS